MRIRKRTYPIWVTVFILFGHFESFKNIKLNFLSQKSSILIFSRS
jgi:hypothetical protein